MNLPENEIESFIATSIMPLEGWINPDAAHVICLALNHQYSLGDFGGILEFGVWKGKLLSLLCKFRADGESVTGVDAFVGLTDAQAIHRTQEIRRNIESVCGSSEFVDIFRGRSTGYYQSPKIVMRKVISIDGGNDFLSRVGDLEYSSRFLTKYGIIIMNGVFNRFNPDSSQALFHFLASESGRDFCVVADCNNKTILCRRGAHSSYYDFFQLRISRRDLPLFVRTAEKLDSFGTHYSPRIEGIPIIPFA